MILFLKVKIYPIMATILKQTLEGYCKQEEFCTYETMKFFKGLAKQIADSEISDDLKKEFKEIYQDVCDVDDWQEITDESYVAIDAMMGEFISVVHRIVKEL
jgi:hypothetical protein